MYLLNYQKIYEMMIMSQYSWRFWMYLYIPMINKIGLKEVYISDELWVNEKYIDVNR